MSFFQKAQRVISSFFSKPHDTKDVSKVNDIEESDIVSSIVTINNNLSNFIYNNTSVHPLVNQVNIHLLKFLTVTNSIILSCENFYYCKSNMISLIRLKLYESFLKILTKYILPNHIKPIKCFDLAKIDSINTADMYYYSPSLMKFFRVFTRNIVKYHSLKISKCLQDKEASQEERLEFVFSQFINGFYMITEQLGGISISCEDLKKDSQYVPKQSLLWDPSNCRSIVDKYVRIYLSDIINMYDAIAKDIITALQLLIPNNVLIIFDFKLLTAPKKDTGNRLSLTDCPNVLSIIDSAKDIGKCIYAINYQHVDLDNTISVQNCLNSEEELNTLVYLWRTNNFIEVPSAKDIEGNVSKANIYKLNKNIEKMKYALQQIQA